MKPNVGTRLQMGKNFRVVFIVYCYYWLCVFAGGTFFCVLPEQVSVVLPSKRSICVKKHNYAIGSEVTLKAFCPYMDILPLYGLFWAADIFRIAYTVF